jgi:hypothetical protein
MTDNNEYLSIQIAKINRTDGIFISKDETIIETKYKNKEDLLSALECEFGKCVDKLWVYSKGKGMVVGWIFKQKKRYSDSRKFYTQETWVTIYKDKLATEDKPELEHA